MPVKHDLYQDLGLSKEVVHERRASDKRLDSLLTQYDDADKEVLKATAGAGVVGFALHDYAREQDGSGVVQYGATEAVSVLTQGRMWVETTDAVVAGATANLTVATGKLTDEAVAAGIEAFTQISVKFLTATTGAGLALVEIK